MLLNASNAVILGRVLCLVCVCVCVSNDGRGVWDGPRILCGAWHYGGTILISAFHEFFASIEKIFILGGRLGAGL